MSTISNRLRGFRSAAAPGPAANRPWPCARSPELRPCRSPGQRRRGQRCPIPGLPRAGTARRRPRRFLAGPGRLEDEGPRNHRPEGRRRRPEFAALRVRRRQRRHRRRQAGPRMRGASTRERSPPGSGPVRGRRSSRQRAEDGRPAGIRTVSARRWGASSRQRGQRKIRPRGSSPRCEVRPQEAFGHCTTLVIWGLPLASCIPSSPNPGCLSLAIVSEHRENSC